ncbi:NADH dehydrogenase subunit J [Muriicola jejuensis]|uniref:NADH-quinone oxidoreductase subunit J n=1 Tax=Muriicola jejuensis TaxID=504488 RepID=A0A6P0UAU8_9FLAO|nr:NADH-quinone oxidoreductase subunit J [Muriicola jejuensis]NER10314.1 NADH-quinone oxidoreductase subunit J [Muriicola jejuensis]SMP01346.1 NADH dehydrogenase subunit J [Muriicola jejuensis]
MERILFYILALIMIGFALASVMSRRMLRSVIYLLFVLCAVAGVYFMMDYNFLAAIQLTIYAGGIIVLIIFSVLLVHHIEMRMEIARPTRQLLTALACSLGLAAFLSVIYTYDFQVSGPGPGTEVSVIGAKLLDYGEGGFILPFEVISVLLLAAMVGAIVIAKGTKLSENKNEVK